jgi:methylated-DNA-[protein]-cysteine S-methyltransferase
VRFKVGSAFAASDAAADVSDADVLAIADVSTSDEENSDLTDELIENNELDIFKKAIKWLDDYFNGLNPVINFKLKPQGTEFRINVWKVLSEIPYGKTMTYGEIASQISPTMSAQAVGGAVGANPISIMIPCHRVIGVDGKLTGYAGGIERKIELLKLEKAEI